MHASDAEKHILGPIDFLEPSALPFRRQRFHAVQMKRRTAIETLHTLKVLYLQIASHTFAIVLQRFVPPRNPHHPVQQGLLHMLRTKMSHLYRSSTGDFGATRIPYTASHHCTQHPGLQYCELLLQFNKICRVQTARVSIDRTQKGFHGSPQLDWESRKRAIVPQLLPHTSLNGSTLLDPRICFFQLPHCAPQNPHHLRLHRVRH
mmetsp:Transcript_40737/g.77801  ORF Transcript_40737/g.77801 Transcript_40737/m.77801 type:complete len:205 (-) Transcript_40737:39-653(-)